MYKYNLVQCIGAMSVNMKMDFLFLLVLIEIVTCDGQQLDSCKIVRNQAIQHVYRSVSAATSIDCCRGCSLNGSCVAVNYEERTGTCELNNENPYVGGGQERMVFLAPRCNDPWAKYMGSCYTRSDRGMIWNDAEEYCVSFGGHLADIHTQEENAFVTTLAAGETVWIGLTDIWNDMPWQWVTGVDLVYENFQSGEPNNMGENEDCVEVINSGKWNDKRCSRDRRALCKKPAF